MTLAVPLSQAQIDAACHLHERLDDWRLSDAVLTQVRRAFPGFDREACLLKSIAVNTLYATQVFAIVRMARHVHDKLATCDLASVSIDLVDRIAALPREGDGHSRQFVSFAAKFCHFFVEEERFPIYDEAARTMLKLHLGRAYIDDRKRPYPGFCQNVMRLRELGGLDGPGRDLDRYLWIAGMYARWLAQRDRKDPLVNRELLGVFRAPTADAAAELDALLPVHFDRPFKHEPQSRVEPR